MLDVDVLFASDKFPLTKVLAFLFNQYNICLQSCIPISYYTLPKGSLRSLLESRITTYKKEAETNLLKEHLERQVAKTNIWG